jgi:hypothetical protein
MKPVATLLLVLAAGCTVHIDTGRDLGAALGLAIVGGAIYDYETERRGARDPGALDPGRRVNEQDCTRPIEDPSANLKCR